MARISILLAILLGAVAFSAPINTSEWLALFSSHRIADEPEETLAIREEMAG